MTDSKIIFIEPPKVDPVWVRRMQLEKEMDRLFILSPRRDSRKTTGIIENIKEQLNSN
jgi:hypothetical protein